MPTSTAKTILFCRVQVGKKMHLYPVSVHVNETSGKNHGARLWLAYKSGDGDTVKALDPSFPFNEDGSLPAGAKWSIKVVPYEPKLDVIDTGMIESEPSET